MLKRLRYAALIVVVAIGSNLIAYAPVHAAISSCTASVSPHSVYRDANQTLIFDFSAQGGGQVEWVEIDAPSADFRITSSGDGSWSTYGSNDQQAILTRTGAGDSVPVSIVAGSTDVPAADWLVKVSDQTDGSDLIDCTGSLGVAIDGDGIDRTTPFISGLAVSNITATSATVSWNTDEPASSKVDFGPNQDYDQNKYSLPPKTSHSLTLTGLIPATAYHYQVSSADAANNIGTSADSTFMTASITQSSNQPINTVVPIKAIPTESVPPTIVLTTSLQTPFKQTPTIRGEATDNEALAGIEYSTDGGQNWLPTDGLGALPSKKTTFSFTPVNLDDGNYAVLARAIDTSGNTAKTATATLVIDRLPPQVGGNVISLGPQILTPDKSGVSRTLVGIDQKITLSAVGGPTAITLTATSDKKNNSGKPMSFSLAKSADTGLWSGILVFTQPGNYSLTANSIDGAGNKTSRIIQTLQIQTPAQVIDTSKRSGLTATVTAYYFEPELREWAVWDGGAYGQKNPQTTGKNGAFALMLPPGKYYFKTTAGGYRNLVSTIFTTDKPTPITSVLAMKKKTLLAIGNDVAQVQIGTGTVSKPNEKQSLAGHVVPSLSLQASNGQTVNSLSWLGKPTVLTLTSIWSPATAQQVPALTELQKNTDINVVPVAVQERIGKTRVYSELSGYKLQWLADSDSALTNNLKVQSIPTHYFVDRKGIVRKTITGTLTKDEILESLTNL